jgi:hypothetical protein
MSASAVAGISDYFGRSVIANALVSICAFVSVAVFFKMCLTGGPLQSRRFKLRRWCPQTRSRSPPTNLRGSVPDRLLLLLRRRTCSRGHRPPGSELSTVLLISNSRPNNSSPCSASWWGEAAPVERAQWRPPGPPMFP